MRRFLKKQISLLLAIIISSFAYSCSTSMPVAQSGGSGDQGALLFVSAEKNINKKVYVTIDDYNTFTAKAVKPKSQYANGKSYYLSSGKHKINVSRNGKTLYNKFIYISPKETKLINIP